jgi:hypothetical protein
MIFQGKYPPNKIYSCDNQTIEQVKNFNYLGCDLSSNHDENLQNNLFNFQHICGNIKRTLTKRTRIFMK